MRLATDPFRLLLISLAGWLNQRQQDVIEYPQEENRVLPEQHGGKWLRDPYSDSLTLRGKASTCSLHSEPTLKKGALL